jgi:nucleoside-triphosphatase THEP1
VLRGGGDAWKPVSREPIPDADFCLLEIHGDLPAGAAEIPLARSRDLIKRTFASGGFPNGWDFDPCYGIVVSEYQGRFVLRPDPTKTPSLQLYRQKMIGANSERPAGVIYRGFSGGPVEIDGAVVGMIVEARDVVRDVTAYMMPSSCFPERLMSRARHIAPEDAIAVRPADQGSPNPELITNYLRGICADGALNRPFIERKVVQQTAGDAPKTPGGDVKPAEEYIDEAAERVGKMVLLGEPGLGKSTILKRLDQKIATRTRNDPRKQGGVTIPILIELKSYLGQAEIEVLLAERVNSVLRASQTTLSVDSQQSVRIMKTWLSDQNFRFVILLDAMDELPVAHHQQARTLLRSLLNYPHHFVVSCRAADYDQSLTEVAKTFSLVPLTKEEIQLYLKQTLHEKADELFDALAGNSQLLSLASNPLFLSMIAEIAPRDMTLMRSRGLLFRGFVKAMIERRRRSGSVLAVAPDIVVSATTALAYEMRVRSKPRPLLGEVRKWTIPRENETIEAILSEAKKYRFPGSDGFAADPIEFIHPSWGEYLAAEYLNDQLVGDKPEFENVLGNRIGETSWREVIVTLIGLLTDPAAFFNWFATHLAKEAETGALFTRGQAWIFVNRTQVRFFCDCWENASDKIRDQTRDSAVRALRNIIQKFDPAMMKKSTSFLGIRVRGEYDATEFESALVSRRASMPSRFFRISKSLS